MVQRPYSNMARRRTPVQKSIPKVFFFALAVLVAFVIYGVAKAAVNVFSGEKAGAIAPQPTDVPVNAAAMTTPIGDVSLDKPLQQIAVATPVDPWTNNDRITILLLGLDYRDTQDPNEPSRSDTMILASFDPKTKTGAMLSIPRDLYVEIPGTADGFGKINTAYFIGEAYYKNKGGGPELAMKTVEKLLGIPIQYYAQVDFTAFVRLVDEVDGVRVEVKEPIRLHIMGPMTKKVDLQPGVYTLPGDHALAYARERYSGGNGDFGRAYRTQQVILAVKDRIFQFDMLPKLIARAPALYSEVASGVRTNLSINQAIQLVTMMKDMPSGGIRQGTIDESMTTEMLDFVGEYILMPDMNKVYALRDQLFLGQAAQANATPISGEIVAAAGADNARVAVQNGAGVDGLASRTSDWLRAQGVNVVDETNADGMYDATTIFVYNSKPQTLEYLTRLLDLKNIRIYNRYDPNITYDMALILGPDWAQQNPMGN